MPDIYDDSDLINRANAYLESQKPQNDYLSDWNAREDQIAKMREAGQIGEPTGVVEMPTTPQPRPEREMSFGENMKDLGKAFVGGAIGVAADTLRGADWGYGKLERMADESSQRPKGLVDLITEPSAPPKEYGLPSFRSAAESIDKYQEKNFAPEQEGLSRDIASGLGSLATFFIPGGAISKGAGFVGKGVAAGSRAAKALELTGLGVSTGLEALGETGGVLKANQKENLSQEENDRRATNTLLTNMALIGVTNKLGGMFEAGRRGSIVRKGVEGTLGEGVQEAGQSITSQSQIGEGNIDWKQVAKEGAIGGIIGGGAGMAVQGVEKARLYGFDKAADAWVEKANESLSSGAIQSMNDEQFKKVYDNAVTLNEVMNTEGDVRPEYFETLSALDNEYKRRQGIEAMPPPYEGPVQPMGAMGDSYTEEILKVAGLENNEAMRKATAEADRIMGIVPPATSSDGGVSAAMDAVDLERAQNAPAKPLSAFPSTMEATDEMPVQAERDRLVEMLPQTGGEGDIAAAMDTMEAERKADPYSRENVEARYQQRIEQAKQAYISAQTEADRQEAIKQFNEATQQLAQIKALPYGGQDFEFVPYDQRYDVQGGIEQQIAQQRALAEQAALPAGSQDFEMVSDSQRRDLPVPSTAIRMESDQPSRVSGIVDRVEAVGAYMEQAQQDIAAATTEADRVQAVERFNAAKQELQRLQALPAGTQDFEMVPEPQPKVLTRKEQAKADSLQKQINTLTKSMSVLPDGPDKRRMESKRADYEFELKSLTESVADVLTPEEQARVAAMQQEKGRMAPALPEGQGFDLVGQPSNFTQAEAASMAPDALAAEQADATPGSVLTRKDIRDDAKGLRQAETQQNVLGFDQNQNQQDLLRYLRGNMNRKSFIDQYGKQVVEDLENRLGKHYFATNGGGLEWDVLQREAQSMGLLNGGDIVDTLSKMPPASERGRGGKIAQTQVVKDTSDVLDAQRLSPYPEAVPGIARTNSDGSLAGDGPMFRKSPDQQNSPTVSTQALKAALAGTPYGSNVIVLDSPALLPDARLRLQLKRTGNLGAKGAYDAKTGKTYLFAHNAESMADAMETAKGEILHRGTFVYAKDLADKYGGDVQKAFNELNALHMQVMAVRGPEINAWLEQEGYKDLVSTPRGANEWLAHEGIKVAPKWYDRYVAAVMKFFRKVGKAINFDFGLTEAEIRNFSRELLEAGASGRETLQGKNPSPMLQRAYHGSPHRGIVRFDWETYAGSGEGNASFGAGTYVTDSKELGEKYREATSGQHNRGYIFSDGKEIPAWVVEGFNNGESDEIRADFAERIKSAQERVSSKQGQWWVAEDQLKTIKETLDGLSRLESGETPSIGQLYETNIPESDELLDWDKPLSEQPVGVREKLKAALGDEYLGSDTGARLYKQLSSGFLAERVGIERSPQAASQYLRSIGIPGHRYLDGMSRDQGDGSHNYVIYDDSRIDITGTFYRKATPQATLSQQPPADPKGIKGYINETSKALAVTAKGAWNDTNDASWIRKVTTSPEYWTDEHAQKMFDVFNQRDEIASKYVHDFMAMPGKDQESVIPFFQQVAKDPAKRVLLNEGVDYADVNEVSEKDMLKWWQDKNAPADVVEAWKLMRQGYDKALEARLKPIKAALENTKRDAKITVKDENGKDQTISLKQLINRMGALKGTYAPRIRETGDFVVKGTFKYSDGRVENFRAHKESRLAANKLIQEMRGKGYEMEEVSKTTHLPEGTQQTVKAIELAKAIEGALSDMTGVDEKTKAEFAKTLAEGVADEIKARGFRSASIRRQKENVTKGYIEDATERFQKYMFNTANGLAKMETAGKAVDVMFGEVKDGKRQGGIDIKKKPEIHSLLTEYMNEQLRNQDKSDRTLGKLKALATLKFLGFNIKSAAVNLTALATNVPAALHTYAMDGKGSLTSAMPVLGKSVKDFAGFMRDKKLQNADEQAFLEDAHKRGLDDAKFTRESSKKFGDTMGNTWSLVMEKSMRMFGITERLNRGGTLLAAYRLARQRGLSHAEASSIAQHTSNRAHGVYSKAANPTWAWGTGVGPRIGQSVYVYQKFMHNYFQMIYEMVGKKDYKAAAYALTAPLVIAGGTGQMVSKALAYTIAKAAMAVAGDEGDPEKWMYDKMREIGGKDAETFARYGLAGLAGLNLSGSMGTIPSIPTDLAGLAGAPGGIFKDMGAAASYLGTGEFTKAAEKALPSAIGKPIQAVREANEGVTTASGYRVLDDDGKPYKPSLGESVAKAMAFSPAGESMQRQRTYESKTEEGKFSERSKKIYERIRAAAVDGKTDPTEMQAIANEVTKYNASVAKAGNPAINQITPQSVANQFKAMEMPNKKDLKRLAGRQDVEGEVFTPDMVETASHPYNVVRAKANRDHQDYLEMKKTDRQGAEKFWHQDDRFRRWAVLNDYGKEITRLRQSMEKVQDSQMPQAAKERQLAPMRNRVKVLMDRAVSRVQ